MRRVPGAASGALGVRGPVGVPGGRAAAWRAAAGRVGCGGRLVAGREVVDLGAVAAGTAGPACFGSRPETSTGCAVRGGRADGAVGAIVGGRPVDARASPPGAGRGVRCGAVGREGRPTTIGWASAGRTGRAGVPGAKLGGGVREVRSSAAMPQQTSVVSSTLNAS
ncbi:hypothetical protein ASD16_03375 [Cellulomonas sp. Root485]|nr:hypothetical protein ASD16_03375 [Cellulomonas sp. Root485]